MKVRSNMLSLFRSDKQYRLKDLHQAVESQIKKLPAMVSPIGVPLTIFRYEFPCEEINILSWLASQKTAANCYWSNRENNLEVGGIGRADHITGNDKINHQEIVEYIEDHLSADNPHLAFYGGMCFDDKNPSPEWKTFGTYHFFVPRFEVRRDGETYHFAVNIALKDMDQENINVIVEQLASIQWNDFQRSEEHLADVTKRTDYPNKKEWDQGFINVQKHIAKSDYQKIVLARKSHMICKSTLHPIHLLGCLKKDTPHCYHFCFQFEEGHTFIGASPERLFRREKDHFETEALAGTKPRSDDSKRDQVLANELIESQKNNHEHKLVVDSLKSTCQQLCSDFSFEEHAHLLKLNAGHHLLTHFSGKLKQNITDDQILKTIHPTPALAGFPIQNTIDAISKIEPFSRGWYAGPVGYIGYNHSEFAVGIRSGLVEERSISLFAGAGIVQESESTDEWEEIEHKIGSFIKIFEHEPCRQS
jgi:menaquinone-specific isochorismate synthase